VRDERAATQDLLVEGKICRIGVRGGCFIYTATDSGTQDDTLTDGPARRRFEARNISDDPGDT
jgi:hypothetical protein